MADKNQTRLGSSNKILLAFSALLKLHLIPEAKGKAGKNWFLFVFLNNHQVLYALLTERPGTPGKSFKKGSEIISFVFLDSLWVIMEVGWMARQETAIVQDRDEDSLILGAVGRILRNI